MRPHFSGNRPSSRPCNLHKFPHHTDIKVPHQSEKNKLKEDKRLREKEEKEKPQLTAIRGCVRKRDGKSKEAETERLRE